MNIQLQLNKAADFKQRAEFLSEAGKSEKQMLSLFEAYNRTYQKLAEHCAKTGESIFNYEVSEWFDYETFEQDVKSYQ